MRFLFDSSLGEADEFLELIQAETVEDATRNDLLTIQSTGSLPDAKRLAELVKRKLTSVKCVLSCPPCLMIYLLTSMLLQDRPILLCC